MYASWAELVLPRKGSRDVLWKISVVFKPLDIPCEKGVGPSLSADSIISRKQHSRRQVQHLYGSLEGERRQIGAHISVQCVLAMGSNEEPYHILQGKAELAPVL